MSNGEFSRREFMSGAAKIAVACCFLPSVLEASEGKAFEGLDSLTLDLSAPENAPLKSPGGAVYAKTGDGKRTVIVWNRDGKLKAFSSACTHKGVKLELPKGSELVCPAHGARFDASGSAVKGPAKKSLAEYKCSVEGSTLTVSLKG